jgi:uncharacterized phiE125 gp8 family phage protein
MLYDLTQSVAPTAAVLSPADMRAHLRLDSTDQDTLLAGLIGAATLSCESEAAVQCVTATWKMHLPGWWGDSLELPRSPLQAVASVEYVDAAGDTQTLASSNYQVVTEALVGRIHAADGASFPTLGDVAQAVTITFTAGWGAAASSVPDDVRHFIKLLAAHWYAHAEPVTVMGAAPAPVPDTLRRLMAGFTRRGAV